MNEIFVLGAGASAASGNTPLGYDLVWNYHANCSMLKTYDKNGQAILNEDNERFSNFDKFLDLVERHFPELIGIRKRWLERGDSFFHPLRFFEKKYYVDEILETVQKREDVEGAGLIKNLIFEHIVFSSLGYPDTAYKEFKQEILIKKPASSVSIISFNFDFLLREDFKDEISFDYLIKFDLIERTRTSQYKGRAPIIPLIKLNGSLDWGICHKCDRMHLYFLPRDKEFFHRQQCERCGGSIQPFIVMPHEKYSEKLDALWNAAESKLKQAGKITIIGYSFPMYDKKVISLFERAMNSDVDIEVIDYCESNEDQVKKIESVRKKYKQMFPMLKREIRVSVGGFRAYLDERSKHLNRSH